MDEFYNNPLFSDGLLNLLIKGKDKPYKTLQVSRLLLATSSEEFFYLLNSQSFIDVKMESVKEADDFEKMILLLYKEKHKTSNNPTQEQLSNSDCLDLLIISLKYKVTEIITYTLKQILKNPLTATEATFIFNLCLQYEYPELKNYGILIIRKLFNNTRDIAMKQKEEFLSLSVQEVKIIISNPELSTDTENSILALVVMWIFHKSNDGTDRMPFMKDFLPFINFHLLEPSYLLDFVPHLIMEFKYYSEIKKEIKKKYSQSSEIHIGGKERILKLKKNFDEIPRVFFPQPRKFTIKCEFNDISEWKPTERYYSQPVFSNGYEFYFFLRFEETEKNSGEYNLAGYLRCIPKAIRSSINYYLKIRLAFEVVMDNDCGVRRFSDVSVEFEHPEKAIGSRLNLPDEKWESIKNGICPLVVKNTITVIITVEFEK